MHVVATAGHVDHGKSTLVLALTGTDPDRWAEEKARGLTIDLGFAHSVLPSGAPISFVDVPGHVRFLKNMLAGVGAVDACLFVVAATEGWKPQSEEHLRILDLLGVRRAVIALTKVGLVDDEWRELAQMDVSDRVAGTFLENAPIVAVDAPSGYGVSELRAALDAMLEVTPTAADRGRPRLWIDRVFAAKGSGTVVTGTLAGGALHIDDNVQVLSVGGGAPVSARIRGLQSHGAGVVSIDPGHRVAVNLAGVSHDALARGDALVRPSQWHLTRRFDASLSVLASLDHEVSRRGAYAAYLGAGEHAVKVRILGALAIEPGGTGLVRVHLACDLPLVPGDRFILRDHGREETVGGGEVLDVAPVRPASKAHPTRDPSRVVEERGWVELDALARLTGEPWAGLTVGGWAVAPSAVDRQCSRVAELVEGAGALGLDVAALNDRDRAVLASMADFVVVEGRVVRPGAVDPLADHPFVAALEAAPFAPPDAAGVDRAQLRELIKRGSVAEHDGVYFAASAVALAARRLAAMLADQPDGVTVAEVRDELGVTRKYALPLLAILDSTGVTRRRGDVRIGGPRLPGG